MILMLTFVILKKIMKAHHAQIVHLKVTLTHQTQRTAVEGGSQNDNSSGM
jgi:hypothetical protein